MTELVVVRMAAYKIMRELTVREERFKNPNPVQRTDL